MSVFDDAYEWPDTYKACGAPHQSPINLSQSFSLPCDRLCEWNVDDSAVGNAYVSNSVDNLGGLLLGNFQNGKPTAKFNGDGYSCQAMILYSTSQHSLEGVFGEGELVCYFTHPGGKKICMSVIVRSTPGETASSKFFNAFVPYAENNSSITLPQTWSLMDVIPDTPSYYIYTGTTIWPGCEPDVTWIVYSNTVSIDPSDYAKLVRVIKPARRPLEEVADREVTFFDAQGISTPRDGKLYMRCRRVPKKQDEEQRKETANNRGVRMGGLQEEVANKSKDAARVAAGTGAFALYELYLQAGGIYGALAFILLLLFGGLLFFTDSGKKVGAVAFVVVFFIPHSIHMFFAYLFGLT